MKRSVKVISDFETSYEDKVILWKCRVWRVECLHVVREDPSEKGTHELRPEWWEGASQVKPKGRQFQTKVTASAKAWGGKEKQEGWLFHLGLSMVKRKCGMRLDGCSEEQSGVDYITLLHLWWFYFLLIWLHEVMFLRSLLFYIFHYYSELVFIFFVDF